MVPMLVYTANSLAAGSMRWFVALVVGVVIWLILYCLFCKPWERLMSGEKPFKRS